MVIARENFRKYGSENFSYGAEIKKRKAWKLRKKERLYKSRGF